MKLCFILPGETYTSYFLMVWTDLVLKCAQKGHEVMVSQRHTLKDCFESCKSDSFEAYMCIDPSVVFTPDDVFKLLESPHDITGSLMMSPDCRTMTCGRTMESFVHNTERYIEVDAIEPSWLLIRAIPAEWDFASPLKGFVDSSIRVGNRQVVTL